MKTFGIAAMAAAAFAFSAFGTAAVADPGDDATYAVTPASVASALARLGYATTRHDDAEGDPHLVIVDGPDLVEAIAVFFDDCGTSGCEDITFYADLGTPAGGSMAHVNAWNHPSAKTRSKAFMHGPWESPDGGIGLTMTISFYTDREAKKIAWLAGIFIVETQMFAAALAE